MGVDDTHAYIASGMIPAWYLVAVNLENGEQQVLLESPTKRVMDIIERFPGAYARVPQGEGAPDKECRLYHGRAIPMTNGTPPWPARASPWDKAVPKPEVYFDQVDPVGWPTFVVGDLYLSGNEELRRIRNLALVR